jgi:hypothetical protein
VAGKEYEFIAGEDPTLNGRANIAFGAVTPEPAPLTLCATALGLLLFSVRRLTRQPRI